MNLCDVDMQSGRVVVWGDIFSFDTHDTRDGTKTIFTINFTDYTSSNTLKVIAEKAKAEAAKQAATEEQRKADAAKANLRKIGKNSYL